MLFPALPWEPCLYYNKAQPRSFLGQTSAAGHLLIVSFPEHRRGRDGERRDRHSRGSSVLLLVTSCALAGSVAEPAWEPAGLQTAVHPQLLRALRAAEEAWGDSPCVCPWAGSPPGSRGADVIQQLFWQALSRQRVPRGRLDTLPLQPPPASLRSSARGELQDGSEGSEAGEEGILLLTSFCRVFFEKNPDLLFGRSNRFAAKWIV